MRISDIIPTDTGIRIYGIDGPTPFIHITAEDALKLARWIRKAENYTALLEIMRREQARQKEQEVNNEQTHP